MGSFSDSWKGFYLVFFLFISSSCLLPDVIMATAMNYIFNDNLGQSSRNESTLSFTRRSIKRNKFTAAEMLAQHRDSVSLYIFQAGLQHRMIRNASLCQHMINN